MSETTRRPFGLIFMTILITTIGFGVIFPVLPTFARSLGASDWANGWIVAIFSLAQFAFAPFWGKLSDRYGRRPILIFSLLGSAIGYYLTGLAHTIPLLLMARFIDGATGGNIAIAQACLADVTSKESRSKAMALIGVGFGLGFVLGPWLGGELAHRFSPSTPFYAVGVLSLLNALLVWRFLPETLPAEKRGITAPAESRSLAHYGPSFTRLVIVNFLFLVGFSVMTFVFTLFTQTRFSFTELQNGRLFGLIGLIGIFVQGGLLRPLLPRVGEKKLALTGGLCLLAAFVALPLAGSTAMLIGLSSLIAFGNSLLQPTINGLASRGVDDAWQGRAMGLFQSAASLGRAVGPALGGWLCTLDPLQSYGRVPLWTAAGLVLIMCFVLSSIASPNRDASTT
jgi:MFS transporter, DHA1 family, tetracycline resistance protein